MHHCPLVLLGRPRSTGSREQAPLGRLRAAGYLDGDNNPYVKELNIADREVLVFWDYPCLYQKSHATTQGVTLLQLDSFERGLGSINVLNGHVGYKDSAWPYFESLVSTMIKDQDTAVDLPTALSWVRRVRNDKVEQDSNRSIYWLFEHVRRATRQLPVDPDTFDGEIVAKHATNGSDANFLKQKFRQTFHAVMTPAKKMQLRNVPGPSRDHWRIFLTVTLRSCSQLVYVDLSRNEAIVSTLEPFAALHGSLQYLNVSMSAGFDGTLQPLRGLRKLGAWRSKALWSLSRTCKTARQWTWRRALGFREVSSSWRGCHSCGSSTLATRSWTLPSSRRAAVWSGGRGPNKRHC